MTDDALTPRRSVTGGAIDPLDASPTVAGTWRVFGTSSFFRLWLAQVVSSIGDWMSLVAIIAIAARVSDRPEAAISLVMVARMLPGFFLAPVGGVIADRFDRKRLMVITGFGRAAVVATIPFVDNLWGLILASFALELFTLLWTPAKDASVPNLVPERNLVAANSLGMVAAFGTFPVGAGLFASMAVVADRVRASGIVDFVRVDQEFLALWLTALTFIASSVLIFTISLPRNGRRDGERTGGVQAFVDLREGMHFIFSERLVRAVILGLGIGLLGGAAVIPLGPVYTERLLGSDSAGFGLLMTGMGTGAALGVITLSVAQRFFPRELAFAAGLVGSGVAIVVAASVSRLAFAVPIVGLFGLTAGAGYVAGFTMLHENVTNELRGRIFAALYTVIRLCIVVSLTVWPLVAGLLDSVSRRLFDDRALSLFGLVLPLPGVRLALWLAGIVVVVTGVLAAYDIHRAHPKRNLFRVTRGSDGLDGSDEKAPGEPPVEGVREGWAESPGPIDDEADETRASSSRPPGEAPR